MFLRVSKTLRNILGKNKKSDAPKPRIAFLYKEEGEFQATMPLIWRMTMTTLPWTRTVDGSSM